MRVTALWADLHLPIEATGSLRVDAPTGRPVLVVAGGDRVRVHLPGWSELNSFGSRSWLARRRAIVKASRLLNTLGICVEIGVSGQRAAALGAGTQPSLLARALRLGRVRIPLATVVTLMRNP